MLGSAVADAVGAPFEFKKPDLYAKTFRAPVVGGIGEMIGGGGFDWAPGEFTDDTQMALALANALIEADGFSADVVWKHFRAWAESARDIGVTVGTSLRHKSHVGAAEAAHEVLGGRTASNGSVMRIAPAGVFGVRLTRARAVELAVDQAALTHHDESASVGAGFVADMIRESILSGDFEASLQSAIGFFSESPWSTVFEQNFLHLLADDFDPRDPDLASNGTVWTAVGQAVWAVRSTSNFHDAIVAAINLGGDTDTVAAIAGAMAGAVHGVQGIPVRWATYVNGTVQTPHDGEVAYTGQDIVNTARRLLGLGDATVSRPEPPIDAQLLHPAGVWAANLDGAAAVPTDFGVVSLCLTGQRFANHPHRRQVYMRDNDPDHRGDHNPNLLFALKESVEAIQAFLDEGRQVVVHCHGGRSRTGFVLKGWYMMHEGVSHDQAHSWVSDTWPHYETWTESFFDLLDNEWSDHVELNAGGNQ
jgi:ADP-ribosyl-[dinitrogen reductase] hydrolase